MSTRRLGLSFRARVYGRDGRLMQSFIYYKKAAFWSRYVRDVAKNWVNISHVYLRVVYGKFRNSLGQVTVFDNYGDYTTHYDFVKAWKDFTTEDLIKASVAGALRG